LESAAIKRNEQGRTMGLLLTGHANDGCSRCQGHSRVSRQQSVVFGGKEFSDA
jgi:hypothetical protein